MQPAPLFIDVGQIMAEGREPRSQIMAAVEALLPGQCLRLVAPFRPEPLIRLLERKGLNAAVEEQDDGHCEVRFCPAAPATEQPAAGEPGPVQPSPLSWPEPERFLDLAALSAPDAMKRMLASLDKLEPGEVLFALLDQEPRDGFADLARRGHQWVGNHDESGALYRIFIRA